jgi:TRAP-type transport system small permease protein
MNSARTIKLLEGAGALALLLLMLLVLTDVIGRSVFNEPVPWSTEMLEILVAAMVFLLYPVLALQASHITVDLIPIPVRLKLVQRVIAAGVGAVLFALMTWCLGRQALRAFGYGEASPILGVPLGWVLGVMSALALLCTLAFLVSSITRPSEQTSLSAMLPKDLA